MPRTPAWFVPAETMPVDTVWMAFPPRNSLNIDALWQLSATRRAVSRVAETIWETTPVMMMVDPDDQHTVDSYLDTDIPRFITPIDNALVGRSGPTPVISREPINPGARRPRRGIHLVDWKFNGFGQKGVDYLLDDVVIGTVFEELFSSTTPNARKLSTMVSEGGSWVSDGLRTAIASEDILLDQARNRGWNKRSIERELQRWCNLEKIIWLPSGLSRSTKLQSWGGHIDQLVNFVEPGRVVLHWQEDPNHPDYQLCRATEAILAESTDASGQRISVIRVPAPQSQMDAHGPVNWSYLDYRVLDERVLLPRFIDPSDHTSVEIFQQLYPHHTIDQVLTQELNDRGYNMRSVTLPIASTRLVD